jgi:hypothetical protein
MTKTIKFILITFAVILLETLYFEFAVSREINLWVGSILSILAVFLLLGYGHYIYKLLIDVLKIKNNENQ